MNPEILIEKLAYGGEGLGRIDGKVCFVAGALPGERVLARIRRDKAGFSRAKLVKVLSASPHRVSPPCPYVEKCGGCQYQHVAYAEELRWKETQVREYMARGLGLDPALIRPIVPSPREYGYRTSVTVHSVEEGGFCRAAFISGDNRTPVVVDKCLLADEHLAPVFQNPLHVRKGLTRAFRLSRSGEIFSDAEDCFFEIQAGGEVFITHTDNFFQNNLEVTAAVAGEVRRFAGAGGFQTFIDLYAGVGTFTLLAAAGIPGIVLAEENPSSLEALRKNLLARNRTAAILEGRVEKTFPAWRKEPRRTGRTLVFLDPPRKGMPERLSKFIGGQDFEAIAYLSCHLGTLVRDLKAILAEGKFEVPRIIPYDMFPRTKHIEVLAFLETKT